MTVHRRSVKGFAMSETLLARGASMAAAFRLFVSAFRRHVTCRHHLHRLVTAMAMMSTLLIVGAARADAQEVIEFYGTDAVGSVRVVFAPDGTVKARSDYLPFGEESGTSAPGGPLPTQRFTGQQRDAEEGLDNFNARSYQTRIGRFTSPDPVFDAMLVPQNWNRYAYALNNPLTYTDPTGLNALACTGSGYFDEKGLYRQDPNTSCSEVDNYIQGWLTFYWISDFFVPTTYAPERDRWEAKIRRPLPRQEPSPNLPDPGTEPEGNVVDVTPVIIEGVRTLLSLGGNQVLTTVVNKIGQEAMKHAVSNVTSILNQRGRATEFPAGKVSPDTFLRTAIKYLGPGYKEQGPGRYVSADGLRQVRFGAHEVMKAPNLHGHFEAYDKVGGRIIENSVVTILPTP
jgi:RHS repeat-associated protein